MPDPNDSSNDSADSTSSPNAPPLDASGAPVQTSAPDTLFGYKANAINTNMLPMNRWTTWSQQVAGMQMPDSYNNKLSYEKTQDPYDQLTDVNSRMNQVPYVKDGDQWRTPAEFLANGGECASYALAKYDTLKRLGWSPDDMKVVVLNAKNIGTHAVLAVNHQGKKYILDNMNPDIREDTDVEGYQPIYSISDSGWQFYKS